jgi:peptide subunit release factor 1 (eRF1)
MVEYQLPHVVVDLHIDRADILYKVGASILYKNTISSGIPSQHNQGGQSQQRFLRKHQEAVKRFLKRVAKETKDMSCTHTGNNNLINMLNDIISD